MRTGRDEIDDEGTVRTGFDYNLQVWVRDYLVLPVGAGRDQYAGRDIRLILERERRD